MPLRQWLRAFLPCIALLIAMADARAQTSSGPCSIAAGRDIQGPANVQCGPTLEQIKEAMLAVNADIASARAQLKELSDRYQITSEALVRLFRILEMNQVPDDQLGTKLVEIATAHREAETRLAALQGSDPKTSAL
ncbi:MAG TPA: hypothetical protein VHP59_31155, partial [Vineibacter terrae]|nr:hypothetical protein [Vineibacter terrae]